MSEYMCIICDKGTLEETYEAKESGYLKGIRGGREWVDRPSGR